MNSRAPKDEVDLVADSLAFLLIQLSVHKSNESRIMTHTGSLDYAPHTQTNTHTHNPLFTLKKPFTNRTILIFQNELETMNI